MFNVVTRDSRRLVPRVIATSRCYQWFCVLNIGKNTHLAQDKIAQIIALKESGLQTKDIVAQLGVSERSVRRWVAKFNHQGSQDTPTHEKMPGPGKKTSDRCRNIVKRVLESNPRISARKLREENPRLLGEVSVRTVSRLIGELGYSNHRAVKKPLLTRRHKVNRVQFARKYGAWDEKWLTVLWSDESTFTVTCNRDGYVYRRRGSDPLDPRYTCATVKHPDSLMVWGAFTGHGKAQLHVFHNKEKVNQYNYLELLCDVLPQAFEDTGATVFQQDGAKPHTAKSVTQWLRDCEMQFIED